MALILQRVPRARAAGFLHSPRVGDSMTRRWLWLAMVGVFSAAAPAQAQSNPGIRAGVSGDPDQFYFGGHIETRPLIERLTFRPNVEIGLGDDLTLIAANIEFAYWFPIRNKPWSVYVGGGPALLIGNRNDDTDVGGGFNILVGLQHRQGLFTEFKVGFNDSPDVKFAVGYVFK
jgi:hypothetical protein